MSLGREYLFGRVLVGDADALVGLRNAAVEVVASGRAHRGSPCFSSTRKYCRNVKHWRAGNMTLRWAGTMMIEAERRFRRLKGFRSMPRLLVTLGRSVDSERALA